MFYTLPVFCLAFYAVRSALIWFSNLSGTKKFQLIILRIVKKYICIPVHVVVVYFDCFDSDLPLSVYILSFQKH